MTATATTAGGAVSAISVAADQYGNVYIADDGPNQRIRVIYGGGSAAVNPAAKLIVLMNPFVTTPVQAISAPSQAQVTSGSANSFQLAVTVN